MNDIYKDNPYREPREGWPQRQVAQPRHHSRHRINYAWLLMLLLVAVLAVAFYLARHWKT